VLTRPFTIFSFAFPEVSMNQSSILPNFELVLPLQRAAVKYALKSIPFHGL